MRWYVYDGLGSVVGEVDVNGVLQAEKKHDVFGLRRGTVGTEKSRHSFVGGLGHYSDDETGLVYMRARYYDPAIGRFISEDPACDGVNWFAYCGNDPTNKVDPSGKVSIESGIVGWATSFMAVFCADIAMQAWINGDKFGYVLFMATAVGFASGASMAFYKALGGEALTKGTATLAITTILGLVAGSGSADYAKKAFETYMGQLSYSAGKADHFAMGSAKAVVGYAFGQSLACAVAIFLIDN